MFRGFVLAPPAPKRFAVRFGVGDGEICGIRTDAVEHRAEFIGDVFTAMRAKRTVSKREEMGCLFTREEQGASDLV